MSNSATVPSLWDDAKAKGLDEPGLLLYRSNLLGADLRITNFGGGNTSAKVAAKDPLWAYVVLAAAFAAQVAASTVIGRPSSEPIVTTMVRGATTSGTPASGATTTSRRSSASPSSTTSRSASA